MFLLFSGIRNRNHWTDMDPYESIVESNPWGLPMNQNSAKDCIVIRPVRTQSNTENVPYIKRDYCNKKLGVVCQRNGNIDLV